MIPAEQVVYRVMHGPAEQLVVEWYGRRGGLAGAWWITRDGVGGGFGGLILIFCVDGPSVSWWFGRGCQTPPPFRFARIRRAKRAGGNEG